MRALLLAGLVMATLLVGCGPISQPDPGPESAAHAGCVSACGSDYPGSKQCLADCDTAFPDHADEG